MLTLQQAGTEILGNQPQKFYVFTGTEYGIKRKYIDHLKQFYNGYAVADTVNEVLGAMQKKSIFPVPPKLYVVRYDDSFVSSLTDKTAARLAKIKINGTVVCLYEDERQSAKCAKYLPEHTVSFDRVHIQYIQKYLRSDFPDLSENCISEAVKIHDDYMGAYNICSVLNNLPEKYRDGISPKAMEAAFGYTLRTEEAYFKAAFAAKNASFCTLLLDNYAGDLNILFYAMLATLIELEKLMINPKQRSDYKQYIKAWTTESLYNMFVHVYSELERSRALQGYNLHDRLLYLLLLLQYNPIPQLGVLQGGI